MMGFLIGIHILVCILLMITILMQSSKGGGMAGVFGGGGSTGGVFGGRGAASFLSKVATWLGVAFAITTLSITFISMKTSSAPRSALQQVMEQEQQSSPATVLPVAPGGTPVAQPEKK
jgi:preprotein translocase subunit SecG